MPIPHDTYNSQETHMPQVNRAPVTQETIVSQTQSFDQVISNKSKQGPTGKPKRSKHPRLHVKQRNVTHRKDTHNVTIPVEAVPVSQERSASNNDIRQTAHNEIGDKHHRHPVCDNQSRFKVCCQTAQTVPTILWHQKTKTQF